MPDVNPKPQRVAEELQIPIKVMNKGIEYLEIVRKPKHGYGSGMNPCIDCRIFLLRKAKEYLAESGADFVITGEVLGQRPMSQRRDAMRLIERESGLEGLLLRPLSAKHFTPTIPEQEGWVDREKLLGITGRSRKEQMQLAEELDVTELPLSCRRLPAYRAVLCFEDSRCIRPCRPAGSP